jgi:predicted transposase/invertase (TIGR01784 family)
MKTDSLFYRLFQTLPELLFDLLARPSAPAPFYRFASVELKQTSFRLDGVLQPPADQPDWPVFFIEVQFQADPELYARLFAEVFLYLRQQRPVHPWHAVVLYPSRTLDSGEQGHYQALLHGGQVTRIYLDEWAQPRRTLGQQLIGVVLADPVRAVSEAQAVLTHMQDAPGFDTAFTTTIVNLVETILVYKLPKLSREEIQHMLNLTDIDLKQTRFYQDVFSEGIQTGIPQGELLLTLRQLQRRCGELTPALRERITGLRVPRLEALGEALLEFHGRADLEQWLATEGQE